jgi:UDP-N-acetylglucosamine--N-acetylmuramyl-(pentapeptide) pyrophosphoryl-undecaprenol N-acetylglucosamine transferase
MPLLHKVIISGGGTGGHIFPAIAIANEIRLRYPGCEILFVGAEGRMEMEKVPNAGYRIIGLPISGIQRKFTLSNLVVPFKLLKSIIKARSIIKDFKPQVVVGVGGYASSAVLYVAAGNGIPTLIQEQNSYAGLTNKWLGKKVSRICVAYEGMQRFFPAGKLVMTGNPVRAEIYLAKKMEKAAAKKSLGFGLDKPLVLVIGGSLGARTINHSMQDIIRKLHALGIQVMWQTGRNYKAETYGLEGMQASEFIVDMATAYAAADIVVSRAGAISVSEISLLQKPAILVPSPNVAEDHQTSNAKALVNRNAAVLLRDADAREQLITHIENLVADTALQEILSKNLEDFARPDALKAIVEEIEKLTS